MEKREVGLQDFVLLGEVNEDGFWKNVETRFHANYIYGYIGDVVVSVNPFKKLDIYKPSDIHDYEGRYKYERPPHIYALANDAYRSMLANKQDQCIIISGESGAGKTEASKIIMQYITQVSKSSDAAEKVKLALLESNPVLEAFGNAKTLRNDNSSRFGKYMEMQFSITGAPIGGRITNYLLEKSRVITRAIGERSFHIFYQMLAGLSEAKLAELKLTKNASSYEYLNLSECLSVESIDDVDNFNTVTTALKVLGVAEESINSIFQILAGILHLGNINFKETNNGQVLIEKSDALAKTASCLGVTEDALTQALTNRSISVDQQKQPQAQKSSEKIFVPHDLAGAIYSRDALAKALYERLFAWLVQTINVSIHTNMSRKQYYVIGILDIYGFEIFERNSFEQLNINYCNEKLQQLFIELTLKSEQEEYVREGIEWTQIDYFNNKTICDLIEKKPIGIISVLDDEGMIGSSTDNSFLQKLNHHFATHPHYQSYTTQKDMALSNTNFRLKHYAGDVAYDVIGMLDKNKDSLFGDLIDLSFSSKVPLLNELFAPLKKLDSKKRPETAGSQFRNAMNSLIQTLLTCNPHYVRCIKPNDNKKPGVLDETRVRHQIRYLGLVENVRVRRAGFAYRLELKRFYQRYKMICKETWPSYKGDTKDESLPVLEILKAHNIKKEEYRIGKTKLFIRNPQTLFYFEEKRISSMPSIVTTIQKVWRGYRTRVEFERLKAAITLQNYFRMITMKNLYIHTRGALMLQKAFRASETRVWYKKTLASIMLQKVFRAYTERSKWIRRKAATNIQLWYRGAKAMRWLMDVKRAFQNASADPLFGKYTVWPVNSPILSKGADIMKAIHGKWRVEKMVYSLDAQQTMAMLEKISSYDIFHGNKPYSFSRKFEHNYLENSPIVPRAKYQKAVVDIPGSKNILFANMGIRMTGKGDFDKRIVIVTESHLLLYKPKFALNDQVPLGEIVSFSMNRLEEWTVVIHQKQAGKDIVLNFFNLENLNETTTELVTVLQIQLKKIHGNFLPMNFTEKITYTIKKQAVMRFQPDPQINKFKMKQSKADHLLIFPAKGTRN